MRDGWTRLAVVSVLVAVVAISMGVLARLDRVPDDIGRGAVRTASDMPAGDARAAQATPSPTRPTAAAPALVVGRRTAVVPPPAVRTLPVAVTVPRLGVRAFIDPVGVEPDGSMTIPRDGDRVGWYSFGAAPGESSGSAVLAGHVDTRRGGPGAFYPLSGVQVGDDVLLTRDDGSELRYRVVGRELLVKTALPVDAIFDRSGPERLTLITCGGPFRPEVRSYRDNVVVTAERTA